eukprot:COSAG05_NODE_1844_length_3977_cov_2.730015_7_plen_244_part_00
MDLKHSTRSYDQKHQVKQSLSGMPHYYRVSLYSADLISGNKNECVFNTERLLPNHREELMNGEWEVFVESFAQNSLQGYGFGVDSQRYNHFGVRVCLPDVCSSQNYHTELRDNAGTKTMQRDDGVGFIPRKWTIAVDRTIDQTRAVDMNTVETFDANLVLVEAERSTVPPPANAANVDRPPIKEDFRIQPLPLTYTRTITVHDVRFLGFSRFLWGCPRNHIITTTLVATPPDSTINLPLVQYL